jgi:hypothetical protein
MGVGGRGAGCRRMRRSPTGRRGAEEAGALAGEAMRGGGRCAMLNSARSGGMGWDAWGQLGGVRSDGWCRVGRVAWAVRACAGGQSVERVEFGRSVGPLGPGPYVMNSDVLYIYTHYIYIY